MPETTEQEYQRLTKEFEALRARFDTNRNVSLQVKAERLMQLVEISDRRSAVLSKMSVEVAKMILDEN